MALRDKLITKVQPFLQEGERVEQVFLSQTGATPWLQGLGGLLIFALIKRQIVAVTDRRIVILTAGRMSGTNPKEIEAEVPRQTKLGPMSGVWSKVDLAGKTRFVHRRFKKDIDEADAALSAPPPAE
jgi:hypothetical protein